MIHEYTEFHSWQDELDIYHLDAEFLRGGDLSCLIQNKRRLVAVWDHVEDKGWIIE